MIVDIDWIAFAFGLLFGSTLAALFFAGLAWSVRIALRTARPMAVLLPSAAVRITVLLAAGWWMATYEVVALIGFVLAFVVLRFVLLTVMRTTIGKGTAQWN